jgi:hypothetical protein
VGFSWILKAGRAHWIRGPLRKPPSGLHFNGLWILRNTSSFFCTLWVDGHCGRRGISVNVDDKGDDIYWCLGLESYHSHQSSIINVLKKRKEKKRKRNKHNFFFTQTPRFGKFVAISCSPYKKNPNDGY